MVTPESGEAVNDVPLEIRQWMLELNTLLISQGINGYKQTAIERYFRGRAHPLQVKAYLELLLKEDKVQKFRYRSTFWWRATTNILKPT